MLTNSDVYNRLGPFRANQPVRVRNGKTKRLRRIRDERNQEVSGARHRFAYRSGQRADVYELIGEGGWVGDISEVDGVVEITYLPNGIDLIDLSPRRS